MKINYLLLFLFNIALGFAQNPNPNSVFIKSESWENGSYIGNDNFGNQYAIQENEFRKSNNGKVSYYKNVSLGKIQQVDLQNPLQLVLFYKQFSTAVLLDNQLNETAKINFSELNTPLNPEAISLASQNRLWVYDILTQKLGLFDILKNTFQPITQAFSENLKFYQSDFNYFYWIDVKQNLYVSNLYGKITFLGNIPDFEELQVIAPNQILYKKENILFHYNWENAKITPLTLNEKSFDSFFYKEQILTIFTPQEIYQYKIILP